MTCARHTFRVPFCRDCRNAPRFEPSRNLTLVSLKLAWPNRPALDRAPAPGLRIRSFDELIDELERAVQGEVQ